MRRADADHGCKASQSSMPCSTPWPCCQRELHRRGCLPTHPTDRHPRLTPPHSTLTCPPPLQLARREGVRISGTYLLMALRARLLQGAWGRRRLGLLIVWRLPAGLTLPGMLVRQRRGPALPNLAWAATKVSFRCWPAILALSLSTCQRLTWRC